MRLSVTLFIPSLSLLTSHLSSILLSLHLFPLLLTIYSVVEENPRQAWTMVNMRPTWNDLYEGVGGVRDVGRVGGGGHSRAISFAATSRNEEASASPPSSPSASAARLRLRGLPLRTQSLSASEKGKRQRYSSHRMYAMVGGEKKVNSCLPLLFLSLSLFFLFLSHTHLLTLSLSASPTSATLSLP